MVTEIRALANRTVAGDGDKRVTIRERAGSVEERAEHYWEHCAEHYAERRAQQR
jgi:hypothetical protein